MYAQSEHPIHCDLIVQRFESWARSRLRQGFSLDAAAESQRIEQGTLARRMESVLGKSPLSYFQTLRVERAVHLLKTRNESVDEIAEPVGYAPRLSEPSSDGGWVGVLETFQALVKSWQSEYGTGL